MSVHKMIRSDGSPRWKVRWKEHGRQRARSFDRERDALRFDGDMKRRLALGEDLTPRGTQTLEEFASAWIDNYMRVSLTAETQDVYATQLDLRILPRLGRLQLREIRPSTLDEFIAGMKRQGVGDATIVKTMTVLQSILQRAVRDEEIPTNPAKVVKKPQQGRQREPIMVAPEKVERIIADFVERGRARDAALVSVLAYAGLRPESEALPMLWNHVGDRAILIPKGRKRGAKDRYVRLLAPLAQDLREWRLASGRRAGPVFPTAVGKLWGPHDWDNWRERVFCPAAVAAGLPVDIRRRDLRSSFATLLIWEGRSVVEVARQLGHSPRTCLDHYAGVFEEYDPSERMSAEDAIAAARELARAGAQRQHVAG